MDSYSIFIAESAHWDINNIDDYYHTISEPETGKKVINEIYGAIESLSTLPERHRTIGSFFAGIDIRLFNVGNYSIFYLVRTNTVNIIRVLHYRRNWQDLL